MAVAYQQRGDRIEFTAGADYSVGDVIEFTDCIGIVTGADVANGDTGAAAIVGVFSGVTAKSGDTFAVGQAVYWDSANDRLTNIAAGSGVIRCGIAWAAKAPGTETATVRLAPVSA